MPASSRNPGNLEGTTGKRSGDIHLVRRAGGEPRTGEAGRFLDGRMERLYIDKGPSKAELDRVQGEYDRARDLMDWLEVARIFSELPPPRPSK